MACDTASRVHKRTAGTPHSRIPSPTHPRRLPTGYFIIMAWACSTQIVIKSATIHSILPHCAAPQRKTVIACGSSKLGTTKGWLFIPKLRLKLNPPVLAPPAKRFNCKTIFQPTITIKLHPPTKTCPTKQLTHVCMPPLPHRMEFTLPKAFCKHHICPCICRDKDSFLGKRHSGNLQNNSTLQQPTASST